MENNICMVSWNRCFQKWLLQKPFITLVKNIWIDPTGFNTNPKGGNRLWRTIFAWFREIEVLKNVFSQESAVTLLKTYESTKRALIQTRRGKPTMENTIGMVSWNRCFEARLLARIHHNSIKNIWIDPTGFNTNPKGEFDYGEHDSHGFVKSIFLTR